MRIFKGIRKYQIGNPQIKQYSYTGLKGGLIFSAQIFGVLGIILFNGFGVFFIIAGLFLIPPGENIGWFNDPRITAFCFSVPCIVGSWLIGGLIINYSPTVWLIEDGMFISHFFIFKVFIPWAEVTNVVERDRWFFKYTLVLAKKITIFHRFASWFYFRTGDPCFVIRGDIEKAEELISMIRSKALVHSKYYASNLRD
jgi:hypothetical protein